MKNLSDDELIAKVAQGDEMAFATLFDRHNGRFLGYAHGLLANRSRAEDITQDFWLKVIRLAESYRGQGHFVAWAYTLLRNAALNELRSQKKWTAPPLGEDSHLDYGSTATDNNAHPGAVFPAALTVQDFERDILNKFELEDVKTAIASLPDNQRAALLLWGVEELTYEEIARELDTTLSAVKSLIFRARQGIEEKVSRAQRRSNAL